MKYGLIPENVLERCALSSGKVPVPVLDMIFSIIKTRSIMVGVRLRVFDALGAGPATAIDLAGRLRLNAEALAMLLRVLVICDYLTFRAGRFGLTKLGKRVVSDSGRDFVGYVMWNFKQWEMMDHMEELVRHGHGLEFHRTMEDADGWKYYQQGMLEIARGQVAFLAAKVPVPMGARRLLDIGGSHGLYAAAICRKRPPMTAVVFDLPKALDHARELARREGIDDVVEHRSGDITRDEPGSGYDTALLSLILHHFQPDDILKVLSRVKKALRKNGTVAIWEYEAPDRRDFPNAGDAAALFFRLTSTAATYTVVDYVGWLKAAGFHSVKIARPLFLRGNALISAIS
jgi:predicted O-methyltransferase YrrM